MVLYRRNRLLGGTYFFTINLRRRSATVLVDYIDDFRTALSSVKREKPFVIEAMVVLPNHIHALWRLPQGDDDYAVRIRLLKTRFVRLVRKSGFAVQKNASNEYDLWQRRYWEHTICDDSDFNNHVDYIHWNPVKQGHARHVADWPYSTFHQYVSKGTIPLNWSTTPDEGDYGEP